MTAHHELTQARRLRNMVAIKWKSCQSERKRKQENSSKIFKKQAKLIFSESDLLTNTVWCFLPNISCLKPRADYLEHVPGCEAVTSEPDVLHPGPPPPTTDTFFRLLGNLEPAFGHRDEVGREPRPSFDQQRTGNLFSFNILTLSGFVDCLHSLRILCSTLRSNNHLKKNW